MDHLDGMRPDWTAGAQGCPTRSSRLCNARRQIIFIAHRLVECCTRVCTVYSVQCTEYVLRSTMYMLRGRLAGSHARFHLSHRSGGRGDRASSLRPPLSRPFWSRKDCSWRPAQVAEMSPLSGAGSFFNNITHPGNNKEPTHDRSLVLGCSSGGQFSCHHQTCAIQVTHQELPLACSLDAAGSRPLVVFLFARSRMPCRRVVRSVPPWSPECPDDLKHVAGKVCRTVDVCTYGSGRACPPELILH